jgi:prephenate dehydrogenase
MKLKKVVIIGTGLIGGSVAKALAARKEAVGIIGVCRRESSLKRAQAEGVFTGLFMGSYSEAARGADLVIIATPVNTIKSVLEELSRSLEAKTVVTDAGSTKKEIVEAASKYREKFSFVGSHPLAGSEKTGVENSEAGLFKDSLCVITRAKHTVEADLMLVKSFWESLGARTEILSPEGHDEALAFTSHLPHVAAYSLAGAQKKEHYGFVSTGLKDTTRIASSDPSLWKDIFLSNRVNVLRSIEEFRKRLSAVEKCIKDNDEAGLLSALEEYKRIRDEIFKRG